MCINRHPPASIDTATAQRGRRHFAPPHPGADLKGKKVAYRPGGSIDAFPAREPDISRQIVKSGARVLFTAENIISAPSAIAANTASIGNNRFRR